MAFSILQRQKDINEAVKIKESINNEIIMKLHKILSKNIIYIGQTIFY